MKVDLFGNVINPRLIVMTAVSEPIVLIQKKYVALLYRDSDKTTEHWVLAIGLTTPKTWRKIIGTFNSKIDAINKAKNLGFGGVIISNSYPSKKVKKWRLFSFPDEKDWASIYYNANSFR